MHNGHYHEEEYKDQLRKAADIRFGPKEEHTKTCQNAKCGKD